MSDAIEVLFKKSKQYFFQLSLTLMIESCNDVASKLFGRPAAQLIGTLFTDFFSKKTLRFRSEIFVEVEASGEAKAFVFDQVQWEISPMMLNEEVSGFLVIGTPLLSLENTFIRYIIDCVPHYIFWKDTNSVFLGCNAAFAEVAGFNSPEEIVGKTDFDCSWTEDQVQAYIKDDQVVMQSGHAKLNFEENQLNAYGEMISALVSKVPMRNERGEIFGILGVYLDISDRKKQEQQLMQAKEAAEVANLAKSNFLATISHELRTPLHGILGMVQLLQQKHLQEEHSDYFKDIQNSGLNMLRLVDDVLDFTKLEMGTLKLEKVEFSLRALIQEVVSTIQFQLGDNDIVIKQEISPSVPDVVCGDKQRLKQVLFNLMGNSVKFTRQGSIQLNVTCDKLCVGQLFHLKIDVKDTGIGIPKNMLDLIFERFIQLESPYTRNQMGAGLGLAICRQIVAMMGGKITVSSELGKGSIFSFDVALEFMNNKEADTAMSGIALDPLGHRLEQFEGTILLVEDIPLNQKVARHMLEDFGCRVDIAASGVEALVKVKSQAYDLIFMDIGLPDKSGVEVTCELRALQEGVQTPIVAMTAHAMEQDVQSFLNSGMSHVITKPILIPDLQKVLSQFLKKPKYHK